MEVDSGRSLVMSTWRTSPTVVSMAGSPVSVLYPQVCASMPQISIDMGRAVSFLRTAGCARFLVVGYGPADEEEPEAAGALFPPQAARAPAPASMSPPSRNCRRERLFVMLGMSLGKVGVTQGGKNRAEHRASPSGQAQVRDAGDAVVGGGELGGTGASLMGDFDGAGGLIGEPEADESVVEGGRLLIHQDLATRPIGDGDLDGLVAQLAETGGQAVVEAVMRLVHIRSDRHVRQVLRQVEDDFLMIVGEQ